MNKKFRIGYLGWVVFRRNVTLKNGQMNLEGTFLERTTSSDFICEKLVSLFNTLFAKLEMHSFIF
jgi:hypothetical protein